MNHILLIKIILLNLVSENNLIELPNTIQNMVALRILKLQNNKIAKLPHELAELSTLEELDCSNNNNLDMVPKAWRGDTESILFICKLHRGTSVRHIFLPCF